MDSSDKYNECLLAMKHAQRQSIVNAAFKKPREHHKDKNIDLGLRPSDEYDFMLLNTSSINVDALEAPEKASRGSIIASMVPDEVILQHSNYSARRYEAALMFIDISGFTDLCERYYTKANSGGPSRLTQVLNSYIGAMVQEIFTHGGDVLNFSGDAMLAMWKKSPRLAMQSVVHSAIDCGLSVQKNYGTYHTDVGVVLKVKVAISAGVSHFTLIGDATHSHYVILGQPVWDVKIAECLASAGDVMTTASAWTYANQAEYITEPFGDGKHTKVLRTGVSWKRFGHAFYLGKEQITLLFDPATGEIENYYREFSLRPVIVSALRSLWLPSLRKFMVKPVIWAVENDEPMEFLTEIRRVVIVFLNIITKEVSDELLVEIVDTAFKCVYSISSASNGLLNKVSMFDKDLMFLIVFGLRRMTHEDEAQKSLLCAQVLQESLVDPNITSVSIGISSGTTYCGVVGHVLRREYTVIGSAVNKAARLMMTYPGKLTCDKETFLKSKMNQQHFRLLEFKPMKGIKKPGPVYEFNKYGWPESPSVRCHPILDRDKELRMFILSLQNAIKDQYQAVDRCHDLVYGVVFIGPHSVGKKRLMDECIYFTPNCVQVARIALLQTDKIAYGLFRQIALKVLTGGSAQHDNLESIILTSVNFHELALVQIHAINVIFGCHFALSDDFRFGDILEENNVKNVVRAIFRNNISSLWIVAIAEATYADDESWRLLLILLDTKTMFVIMTIADDEVRSDVARLCLSNDMLLKIPLSGLSHWYHSALACQFLDVQAIPADLEKVIQSASNGVPGWIQNFIISLVQKEDLSVATVLRTKALENGDVVIPAYLLQRTVVSEFHNQMSVDEYFEQVLESLSGGDTDKYKTEQMIEANDFIQAAVLADTYEVSNVNMSMDADAVILKTFDSLTPFEKILLKCGSVLGLVFSRRMLQYLLQCGSPRKIAEAVAKLFSIRVLECEGGDFTRNTSQVLIHASPDVQDAEPPYCSCIGVKRLADSDLPSYAFCGYMRFKDPLLRTTTYEMLTETKKREMHARALLYLEHYTRRCWYCGSGCFHKMMGKRAKDGLVRESAELKKTLQMVEEYAAETSHMREERSQFRSVVDFKNLAKESAVMRKSHLMIRELASSSKTDNMTANRSRSKSGVDFESRPSYMPPVLPGSESSFIFSDRVQHESTNILQRDIVRSFSSVDLVNCECLSIAMFVYRQIIDHCRGAGEQQKLFEAYLEYADLCVMNSNTPQALRLLNEAETFVLSTHWPKVLYKIGWLKDFCLGRILSLRGACMLESKELLEARTHLYRAMQLFRDPFPTNKLGQMIRRMHFSMQRIAVKLTSRAHVGTDTGLVGFFYEEVAVTLNRLFQLFSECKEYSNAELTAKWSLNYARRSNTNFQLLCESYGNMITIHCYNQEFSKCVELETLAMELCHRKRGMLDDAETRAVCNLYTSVFLFYVEYGKKNKSLEFGLPLMNMLSMLPGPEARDRVVIWVLKLMLSDLRIAEMVVLMKDSLYLDYNFDMSSTIWYYFYAMVILIETGYCVESYQSCERFYTRNGDVILWSKGKDAAWDYFACMWLIAVRVGAWERSVLWENKIKEIISMEKRQIENKLYLQLILLEGLLIKLSREIETSDIKKISALQKTTKNMFKVLRKCCQKAPIYLPRFYLLLAYFYYIKGLKVSAHIYLGKTLNLAKDLGEGTIIIWAEHTRQHWMGTLDPALEDYWTEHAEPDNLLDYRNFSEYKLIVPFTLPLPKTLQR